jgi:hypothetical protein
MSLSLQGVVDAALSANSVQLGTAVATEIFRKAYSEAFKIRTTLKSDALNYLQRSCKFPTVYTPQHTVTNDHSLLAAMRELARDVYEDSFHIQNAKERVLIVGAAAREIRKYHANPAINYLIWGSENKDYDRIIRPALNEIVKELKKYVAKNNYQYYLEPSAVIDTDKVRPKVKRYLDTRKVLEDWQKLMKTPPNIFFRHNYTQETFNTLCFEDSIYNYDSDSITKMFLDTGAQIAYGYALLPMELLFDDYPPTSVYRFSRQGNDAILTFNGGHSNGYIHNYDAWRTLMRDVVIFGNGIQLMVEITTRIGPMCVFKLIRSQCREKIVRTIQVPDDEMYVKVLDLWSSVNHRTCRISNPLVYFSVRESEFFDIFNYYMSLDPKSRSLDNLILAIRRRLGGMALVSRELVAPWDLPKRLVYPFALTVQVYCEVMGTKTNLIRENLHPTSIMEKIKRYFRTAVSMICWPITDLIEWLLSENLTDKLIKYPEHMGTIDQFARVQNQFKPNPIDFYTSEPNEEDKPDCPTCLELSGKMGEQKMRCMHKDFSDHDFEMTTDELQTFRAELLDTDKDPPGLKAVKERCLSLLPQVGFKVTCRVEYLFGGPGTGKSYLLRALSDEGTTLVLAPFTKLAADYTNLRKEDGSVYDLAFKTTHRSLDLTGKETIMVDEFTAFDYRLLACAVYRNAAKTVWLAGDIKQTGLRDDEGLAITKRINVAELSRHELVYNFRNPPLTVAILNRVYGYQMIPKSKVVGEIFHVVDIGAKVEGSQVIDMAFSKNTGEAYCSSGKQTVRSFQGSTHNTTRLVITKADVKLTAVESLAIVALSRHKQDIYIATDGSLEILKFIETLNITDTRDNLANYIPDFQEKAVAKKHDAKEFVEFVLNGVPVHHVEEVASEAVVMPDTIDIESGNIQMLDANLQYLQMVANVPDRPVVIDIADQPPLCLVGFGDFEPVAVVVEEDKYGALRVEERFIPPCDMVSFGDFEPVSIDKRVKQVNNRLRKPCRDLMPEGGDRVSCVEEILSSVADGMEDLHARLVNLVVDDRQDLLNEDATKHVDEVGMEVAIIGKMPVDYVNNGTIVAKAASAGFSVDFVDHMNTFITYPVGSVCQLPLDSTIPQGISFLPFEHPGKDAYLLLDTLLPPVAVSDEITALNLAPSQLVEDNFTTAIVDPEEIFNQINPRGHPKKEKIKFYTHGPGLGKWFDSHKFMQELEVVANRYQPKRQKFLTEDAKRFITALVDLWFAEYKPNYDPVAFWNDEEKIAEFCSVYVTNAANKKYHKRFKGQENPDARKIRFHLKPIFKPDTTTKEFDLYKAGQGISAWDTDVNSMVGVCTRLIDELDRYTDSKEGWNTAFTDNGISEVDFARFVRQAVEKVFGANPFKHGIGDYKKFDASQDEVTQYLERYYLKRLGVSEQFILFYFSFREKYTLLFGAGGKTKVKYTKTSGEPMTLSGNGRIAKVVINAVFRGAGPSVILYKGDDVDKMQLQIGLDREVYNKLLLYTNLDMVAIMADEGEFCGLVISRSGVFPNIARKLNKLCSARFRDYKHFCEYQTAIRDALGHIAEIGVNETIAATVNNLQNCTYEEGVAMFACYTSFAHINEAQFHEMFKLREESDAIPRPDANSIYNVNIENMD